MNILSDYYTFNLVEFPNKDVWQFGNALEMTIDEEDVRVFFSKDNIDINGGSYELTIDGQYYYYDFFESGEALISAINQYGIESQPKVVFLFLENEYIAYGTKTK